MQSARVRYISILPRQNLPVHYVNQLMDLICTVCVTDSSKTTAKKTNEFCFQTHQIAKINVNIFLMIPLPVACPILHLIVNVYK